MAGADDWAGAPAAGTGELALDATLGNAFKLAALKDTLYEKVSKGGLIMIPLLGLGLGNVDAQARRIDIPSCQGKPHEARVLARFVMTPPSLSTGGIS